MKRIDRYLLCHFGRIFGLTLASCSGLYLLVDFFEKVGRFIDHRAGIGDYLLYFSCSLPQILLQVLPLAILMSMVLTLGSLGRNNEVTAMRACGVGLWRIIRPLLLLVLAISMGHLFLSETIAPLAQRQRTRLLEYQLRGRPLPSLQTDHIWYRDQQRIIHVRNALPQQKRLQGVSIFSLGPEQIPLERQEIAALDYREGQWYALEGVRYHFSASGDQIIRTENLAGSRVEIGRNLDDFVQQAEDQGNFSLRQLWKQSRRLQAEGYDNTRKEVELYSRLAAPFACIIMALLGVPFSLQRNRGYNPAKAVGLSLAIGIAYFLLQSISQAFGYAHAFPPLVAAWSANLIFFLLGSYLLLQTRQ